MGVWVACCDLRNASAFEGTLLLLCKRGWEMDQGVEARRGERREKEDRDCLLKID